MRHLVRTAILSVAVAAMASRSARASYHLELTLNDPNPAAGIRFGTSVAALGGRVLVGTPGDVNSVRHGAVHEFDGTSGALLGTFPDPAPPPGFPATNTEFGAAIAAQGNRVVVGAWRAAGGAGRVYVFDATTRALVLTLMTPPAARDFGRSVAFASENLVVGAAAVAYSFDGTSGALLQTFDGSDDSDFGVSVAGFGSDVLVGVSNFFTFGAVCESVLLDRATGAPIRFFHGSPVVGFGTRVLTGCPLHPGSAYVYDGSTGALVQSFAEPNPPNPFAGTFGAAVAPLGTNVVVGSPTAFTVGEGAVYLFDVSTGALLDTIRNPRPDCCGPAADEFGAALASVGTTVIVGAPNEGDHRGGASIGPAPGRVYVFAPTVGRPLASARLSLRRRGGKEKLVLSSNDPSFLFPAIGSVDDPGTGSPGGALLELTSMAETSGAALVVPPGLGKPGWRSKETRTALHQYVNSGAPLGPSPVRSLTLKRGKRIKVVARAVGLALTAPQRAVGIRLITGALQNCALFDAASILRDEPDRFDAKATIPSLADCARLLPPTTTTTSTTSTTTSPTSSTSTTLPSVPCTGGTGYPTCNGTCPPGEQCLQTMDTRNDPTFGCFCYPAGVTPCIASAYPACGGACAGGGACQPLQLIGVPGFCGCVDAASVCHTTVDGCSAGTCPPGQACTTTGDACECAPS